MKIPKAEMISTGKIIVDKTNPNVMDKKNYEALKKVIKKYGFIVPIITNKELVIADGYHRWKAARELGMTEVPVISLDVKEVDRKILRQVLNKLKGSHNEELDLEEFKILDKENAIGDLIDVLPGEEQKIRDLLNDFSDDKLKEEKFNVSEEIKKAEENCQIKLGDVWELGTHRVMCGNATSPEDTNKLMKGDKAVLVFTDPPYNINYKSFGFRKEERNSYADGKYKHKAVFNDNLTSEEYLEFLSKAVKNCFDHTVEKSAIFLWSGDKNLHIATESLLQNSYKVHQLCSWVKNNHVFSPGCLFHKIMEFCVIGFKKGKKPYHNKKFLKNQNNIFELEFDDFIKYLNAWFVKRDLTNKYRPPTQKPKELTFPSINALTEKQDITLDLFGGSGSTLIACEIKNRKCYMMELDPVYCQVIINRWERFTGKKAQKLTNNG